MPSNMNFDDSVMKDIVIKAHDLASKANHEYVTVEHLLAVTIENEFVKEIIEGITGDFGGVKAAVETYLASDEIPTAGNARPRQTTTSIHVIQRAVQQVVASGRNKIEAYDLLIAILDLANTQGAYILSEFGVSPLLAKTYVSQNAQADQDAVYENAGAGQTHKPAKGAKGMNLKQAKELLETYTANLNKLAKEGKIDGLGGREKEIFFISKTLCRRKKNNVMIVGDPGVGKTAIAEGLALNIANGNVAEKLKSAVVYSLDMGALMAGTRFRGDLEERLNGLVQAFIIIAEQENVLPVFFIDEVHQIIGAGTGSESKAMDIANLLKPALQRGALRALAATTYEEYRKHIEKDGALKRRFLRLDVDEPTVPEAIEIIKGLRGYYEDFHAITYTDQAVEEAVKLSARHINRGKLPDKAIDVIDSAGAKNKVVLEDNQVNEIGVDQIVDEIAAIANIPVSKLRASDEDKLEHLEPSMKAKIFGQDTAVEELVNAVYIARAGMREPGKPEGIYLFNGPTGVGKTEVAKQLAMNLDMHFERIDMSEYMEKHSVAKLIGSPPGYVGYEENGGILVTTLDDHPNSVILLDEIEKAHPDIFNILLQLMDYGTVTNSHGKTVHANNCILIMTGNIGSSLVGKPQMGFGAGTQDSSIQEEQVTQTFSPEFRNRLDGIVTFNKLSREVCELVLEKFINELNMQLAERNVYLELGNEAKEQLLEEGFDESMGARPLARVIHQQIKKPLAPKMLFGDLKKGGKAIVGYKDGAYTFSLTEKEETVS